MKYPCPFVVNMEGDTCDHTMEVEVIPYHKGSMYSPPEGGNVVITKKCSFDHDVEVTPDLEDEVLSYLDELDMQAYDREMESRLDRKREGDVPF